MKLNRVLVGCLCEFSLLTMSALAERSGVTANPYQPIIDRNVFGLRVVERVEVVVTPPSVVPPKVSLIGITTVLTSKRAILRVLFPANQASPAVDRCLILAEGQREGEIEIIKIDETAGSVALTYVSELRTVAFEPQASPSNH